MPRGYQVKLALKIDNECCPPYISHFYKKRSQCNSTGTASCATAVETETRHKQKLAAIIMILCIPARFSRLVETLLRPPPGLSGGGNQRCDLLLVETEQMLHTVTITTKDSGPVDFIHSVIEST